MQYIMLPFSIAGLIFSIIWAKNDWERDNMKLFGAAVVCAIAMAFLTLLCGYMIYLELFF